MNLFEMYMDYVKKELIFYKLGYTIKDNDTDIKIITKLFNAKQRFISPKKYFVRESQEFKKTLESLETKYQEAYDEVKLAFISALELQPYLSTKIKKTDFFDKLLLDWNIHHLHLSKKDTNTCWVERSDYLLLFMIEEETIHIIDISEHSKENVFEQQKYLEIIHNNWSHYLSPYRVKREISEYQDLTDNDIKISRKANINVPFIINNELYMSLGDSISGVGTNVTHQIEAMQIKKYLEKMGKYCTLNEKKICAKIYQKTGIQLKKLTLDLCYDNKGIRVIEIKSNCLI